MRDCQYPECKKSAGKNLPLCGAHMKTADLAPLGGWEPPYEPEKWNTNKSIQHSHNCFAYSMNYFDKEKIRECKNSLGCNVSFHVPGKDAGHGPFRVKEKRQPNYMTCSDVVGRTMASVGGKIVGFFDECPTGMSKIAIVVDDKNDLHYYRQDSNGWWSHKPGGRPVTDLDAAGVKIYNPERAVRKYPKEDQNDYELNYKYFCCFLAVPRGKYAKGVELKGGQKTRRSSRSRQRRLSL
jgi:hypothetical protein